MYHCVIFDVDGTLIDTEKAIIYSLQKVLYEELSRFFDYNELVFALGIPGAVTLSRFGLHDTSNAIVRWNAYMKEFSDEIKVYNQIEETLISLQSNQIITGIVTSKTRDELVYDLQSFGLLKYFPIAICADDTLKHKPNPEPIMKFIEVSGINPTQALYVGDTEYDANCACGAGVDFALALWGARFVEGIPVKYKLNCPGEIMKIMDTTLCKP